MLRSRFLVGLIATPALFGVVTPLGRANLLPPVVRGRIATVKIEGDEIVQRSRSRRRTRCSTRSCASIRVFTTTCTTRAHRCDLGRLTMTPTDLLIGDADESDRFDLDLQRHSEQLTAGYTRTLENDALRTWMPDRHDLKAGRVAPPVLPADARNSAPMRPPR
jgi:hypothetical protein